MVPSLFPRRPVPRHRARGHLRPARCTVVSGFRMSGARVALITTSFPLRAEAMSGVFLAELMRHLPTDIDWCVVTPCDTAPPELAADLVGRVRCFRYAPWRCQSLAHAPGGLPAALSKPATLPFLALLLVGLFVSTFRAARSVDLVHANWSPIGVIAGLAAAIAGVPCVTTLRGSDIDLAERRRLFLWLLKACARLNLRLVCVGSSSAERAARLLDTASMQLRVIRNGIAPAFFDLPVAEFRARLRILALGSLVPVKGFETLIQALHHTPEACEVTFVGDGLERSNLESQVANLGLGRRARFLGQRRPTDIPGIMAEHDLLVSCSRAEGRPNVVLEAMAAARVVVASSIPAVREIIRNGETGVLFRPVTRSRWRRNCDRC